MTNCHHSPTTIHHKDLCCHIPVLDEHWLTVRRTTRTEPYPGNIEKPLLFSKGLKIRGPIGDPCIYMYFCCASCFSCFFFPGNDEWWWMSCRIFCGSRANNHRIIRDARFRDAQDPWTGCWLHGSSGLWSQRVLGVPSSWAQGKGCRWTQETLADVYKYSTNVGVLGVDVSACYSTLQSNQPRNNDDMTTNIIFIQI